MADWIHPNQHVRKLIGMGVVTVLMSLWGWWVFNWLTPLRVNHSPLDLVATPGIATGYGAGPARGRSGPVPALLDAAGVVNTPALIAKARSRTRALYNALTLDQSLTPYSSTPSMSCRLAASLRLGAPASCCPPPGAFWASRSSGSKRWGRIRAGA